jgi:SAM-dependent methyltransferase
MIRRFAVAGVKRLGLTLPIFRLRERVQQFDIQVIGRNRRYRDGIGPDGLPLPPRRLMTLVAGTADIGWFLEYGETTTNAIRSMLRRNSVEIGSLDAVLDFGCGCGRMIRHWRDLERTEVHGTDYNPELIGWCRGHLPFASFQTNDLAPPLKYPDDAFDLVYAFSVFTHLPEDLQHRWIAELHRVIRPGGYLLITTHGESYLDRLSPEERSRFERGELVTRHGDVAGTNLCASFHPRSWLEGRLLAGFDIVEFAPVKAGTTDGVLQDMTLARKCSPISR